MSQGQDDVDRMTAVDFMTGLVCAVRLRGIQSFAWGGRDQDRFHLAAEVTFWKLQGEIESEQSRLLFTIRCHLGRSATVDDCIAQLMMSGLLTFVAPRFSPMLLPSSPTAETILERLPGGRQLYENLAVIFLDAYENPSRL